MTWTSGEVCSAKDALRLINEQYWRKKGMILGRCVEMWDRYNQIIDEDVSRDPDLDEAEIHTIM